MIKIQGFKNLTQLAVFDLQASQYLNVAISHGWLHCCNTHIHRYI